MDKNKPIGIFDSGVGGLTVLKEVRKQLSHENVVYFGDTARAPYGEKSKKEIIDINFEIIGFLLQQNVKMIIIGCNTSSALALEDDRKMFNILPIVDLITPGAKDAVNKCNNGRIGVIATSATVSSKAYSEKIKNIDNTKEILEIACPKFVPLVESAITSGQVVDAAVGEYIQPFVHMNVDTLIYGCTHYPFLHNLVSKFLGEDKTYIDPARSTVEEAGQILSQEGLVNDQDSMGRVVYFTSGSSEKFEKLGEMFLGEKVGNVFNYTFDSVKEHIPVKDVNF